MSGHGFHVHGPHDHELEHAAQGAAHGDWFSGRIAVAAALLATVGAIFAYMGGATQANAGMYKNNAAIKKTEASNQWNFYQANSNKQNLAELAAIVVPVEQRAAFHEELARYKQQKAEIQVAAMALENETKDWDRKSDEQMH